MVKSNLQCPDCKEEGLVPFRIFARKQKPTVLQQYCSKCDYPFSKSQRLIISEISPLPKKKKIIYLDQNILSQFVRALHPKALTKLDAKAEQRAKTLYSKIDFLRKAQCIVCPYSWDHRRESVVANTLTTQSFRDLMRMYTYLSNNIRFMDNLELQRMQVLIFAKAWLGDRDFGKLDFSFEGVFGANPHDWFWHPAREPFSYIVLEGEAEEVDKINTSTRERVLEIYRKWKTTPEEKIIEDESLAFREAIVKGYKASIVKRMSFIPGLSFPKDLDVEKLFILNEAHRRMLWDLQTMFAEKNTDQRAFDAEFFKEIDLAPLASIPEKFMSVTERLLGVPIRYLPEMVRMFENEDFRKHLPSLNNETIMNAYLGKVTKGRKGDIDKGEMTDINRIAYVMPYCDAIVTDEFWYKGFKKKDLLTERIATDCEFFCLPRYEELVAYLDEIEKEYADQIALSESILGDLSANVNLF